MCSQQAEPTHPDFASSWQKKSCQIAWILAAIDQKHHLDAVEFGDYQGLAWATMANRFGAQKLTDTSIWVRLAATWELLAGTDGTRDFSLKQEISFAMERFCLQHADGWMTNSPGVVDWYKKYYGLQAKPHLVATPPFERFGPGNSHPRSTRADRRRILFFGKLQYLKGPDRLVKAAVELKNKTGVKVDLDFVGHDIAYPWYVGESFKSYLEGIGQDIKAQLHFHGRKDLAQVHELAQACDIAVIPSRVETFCQAAHELNWMGVPMVLSDIPPFRDHFKDGVNARIFPDEDNGLASVLEQIYKGGHIDFCPEWNAQDVSKTIDTASVYKLALDKFSPDMPTPRKRPQLPCRGLVLKSRTDSLAPQTAAWLEAHHDMVFDVNFMQDPDEGPAFNTHAAQTPPPHSEQGLVFLLKNGDVPDKDFLPAIQRAFAQNPELAVLITFRTDVSNPANRAPLPWDEELLAMEEPSSLHGCVFRGSFGLEKMIDPELGGLAAWDFWLKIAEKGLKVAVLPEVLLRNQISGTSKIKLPRHLSPSYILERFAHRHEGFFAQRAPSLLLASLRKDIDLISLQNSKSFVLGRKLTALARKTGMVR
jgi:glycosyltransferase involved in cell wall biosynthesis